MPKATATLQAVLWFTAAALALSAVTVRYLRTGDVAWEIAAAGVFLFAMGLASLARRRPDRRTE